ncbi:MAG: hypothetical protein U5K54_20605 [Cytophagales bacterium]|nr:hypothetical protein [Cytophagales bacterium]
MIKSTLIMLENSINGVQGMRYMTSDATSAGEATLSVIFEPGTDPQSSSYPREDEGGSGNAPSTRFGTT